MASKRERVAPSVRYDKFAAEVYAINKFDRPRRAEGSRRMVEAPYTEQQIRTQAAKSRLIGLEKGYLNEPRAKRWAIQLGLKLPDYDKKQWWFILNIDSPTRKELEEA